MLRRPRRNLVYGDWICPCGEINEEKNCECQSCQESWSIEYEIDDLWAGKKRYEVCGEKNDEEAEETEDEEVGEIESEGGEDDDSESGIEDNEEEVDEGRQKVAFLDLKQHSWTKH